MKFACLGYLDESKWDSMSQSRQEAMIQECRTYDGFLRENGHWLDDRGAALQTAKAAKTLRWDGEKVIVTDGPYAETKELLGGIGVLEAKDMDQAVELMSKHPGVRLGGPFEVRPIDEKFEAEYAVGQNRPAARKIFVNLPVKDLERSMQFFRILGFDFNPQFTDETAACMVVSEDIYVMLLTEAKFAVFTPKAVSDAKKTTEVLVALSCHGRDEVDDLVKKAVASGGSTYADAKDYGFMYQHGFQDPDGHIWELFYMHPDAVPQAS